MAADNDALLAFAGKFGPAGACGIGPDLGTRSSLFLFVAFTLDIYSSPASPFLLH